MMEGIHIQPHRLIGGLYEVAVEKCSDAVILCFIKVGSGIQKLIWRIDTHIDRIEIS
jgi:hypothetical protein